VAAASNAACTALAEGGGLGWPTAHSPRSSKRPRSCAAVANGKTGAVPRFLAQRRFLGWWKYSLYVQSVPYCPRLLSPSWEREPHLAPGGYRSPRDHLPQRIRVVARSMH